MAATVINAPARIIGATSEMSAQLASAAIGDYFFEEDTGKWYIKNSLSGGSSAWVAVDAGQVVIEAGDLNIGNVDVASGPPDRTPTHTAPTATNASGALLAAAATRKAALLQNIGSVDVFIKLGATAVANEGIRLEANGGAFSMSDMLGNLDVAAINGITASGSAIVLVTEWV